jgi:hypothetical protein
LVFEQRVASFLGGHIDEAPGPILQAIRSPRELFDRFRGSHLLGLERRRRKETASRVAGGFCVGQGKKVIAFG